MNAHLDKYLCERFPQLYADRHGDMRRTCMVWGFSCGDGWFNIIYRLSLEIERILAKIDAETGVPPGGDVTTKQEKTSAQEAFRVVQVKEKFGTLRYYTNYSIKEVNDAINRAERKSAKTCEECGEKGRKCGKGWVYTLCAHCEAEIERKKEAESARLAAASSWQEKKAIAQECGGLPRKPEPIGRP